MSKKILQFPAQILKVESKVDRTLNIRLNTREMGEDAGYLYNLSGDEVWVALSEIEREIKASDIEIPEFIPEYDGEKSYSQRLRAVLFRVWEQYDNGKKKTSDQYYRDTMEKLISTYKDKLD